MLFPVALGLLIGGSVSNLVDRITNGYVTDFIHVSHWPTFNLADMLHRGGRGAAAGGGWAELDHGASAEPGGHARRAGLMHGR